MSRLRRAVSRLFPSRSASSAPTGPTSSGSATYAPETDGRPDPGEVVWGWVPYEDDPARGKDRPVLLLAERDGRWLALMLSSQDHDRDAADEARHGRHWMDVGSGGWDREGRPSEVRLDRLLVLPPEAIRREGAALDRVVFEQVVDAVRGFHPRV
jgi:hypothetical protein